MVGMPIEEATKEHVQNDSSLNIHQGRIAAYKALMKYINDVASSGSNEMYIPDLPADDQRLDDVSMTSYNSVRNSWIAMYDHWKYPDLFVVVQCDNGIVYTQVNKHVLRDRDLSQATLW